MEFVGVRSRLVAAIFSFIFVPKLCATIAKIDAQPGQADRELIAKMADQNDEVRPYKPTSITDDSSPASSVAISSPGIYKVAAPMTKPIVISSSDVSLNLNEYGITINTPAMDAITISPSPAGTLSNVTIHNGYLDGSGVSNAGIYVDSIAKFVSRIFIKNMRFSRFGHGMKMAGTGGYPELCGITSCTANGNSVAGFSLDSLNFSFLASCYALNNAIGYLIDVCQGNLFKNSMAMANTSDGFSLDPINAVGNLITNSMAMANAGTGFLISGTGNLLENSMAMANTTNDFNVLGNNSVYQGRRMDSAGVFSWVNNVPASP